MDKWNVKMYDINSTVTIIGGRTGTGEGGREGGVAFRQKKVLDPCRYGGS
jgi:hypothetical protein